MEKVIKDVEQGADLALKEGYVPTRSKNAKSAADKGPWVTDTIALGVKTGIYCGPFDDCPKTATVNSIQTAPKPRGKVRIIMNQSSPKGKSVNDFIKKDMPLADDQFIDIHTEDPKFNANSNNNGGNKTNSNNNGQEHNYEEFDDVMFDMTTPNNAGGGRSGNSKVNKNSGHPQTPFNNQQNGGVYINE